MTYIQIVTSLITILVIAIFAILTTIKSLKKIKLKEGEVNFENSLPIVLREAGVVLLGASIAKIENAYVAMYIISNNSERLSLIKYFSESKTDLVLIIGGFICFLFSFASYALFQYKFKFGAVNLLNIQSNGDNTLENFDKEDYKVNLVETEYLSLQDLWSTILSKGYLHPDFKENIQKIINKVRESVLAFKSSSRGKKRAFTAIAPIPFLIYAGSIIPKLKFSEFLEIQNRDGNKLKALDTTGNVRYPLLQIRGDFHENNKDDEIVIAVSTTYQIQNCHLGQFLDRGIDVRHIFLANPSHNALVSVEQVNNYASTIVDEIISIKRIKPNIKIVHLICSSKPSIVFKLGQLIDNNTQLPFIISYQQLQGQAEEYPWGIYVNHPEKKGQVVLWNEL